MFTVTFLPFLDFIIPARCLCRKLTGHKGYKLPHKRLIRISSTKVHSSYIVTDSDDLAPLSLSLATKVN
jgi:hypothetical protein